MSKYLPELNFEWSQALKEEPVRPRLVLSVAPHSVAFSYHVTGKDTAHFYYIPNAEETAWDVFWGGIKERFSDLFDTAFENVTVFHQPHQWVLIPQELADDSFSERDYLQTLFTPTASKEVSYGSDTISEIGAINGYLHDILMLNPVISVFPNAGHQHLLSRLIRIHFAIHQKINQGTTACVELIGDQFAYLIFKNNKLVFANLYPMSAPEDIVYYIFRVNQTLMINPKDLHIYISGHWVKKESAQKLIKTYFLNFYTPSEWLPKSIRIGQEGFSVDDFYCLLMD